MRLRTDRHDRDAAGLTYVYPVVSRRARGVSVGVNLNVNRACNWRCAYCQVEGLVRGGPDPVDLGLLERELDGMLASIASGAFMEEHVPEGSRRLNDVAFSGNGEPTSSPELPDAVRLVVRLLEKHLPRDRPSPWVSPEDPPRPVLITNGSLVHRGPVQAGLRTLGEAGGEVWFKLDSATDAGLRAMNDAHTSAVRQERNLVTAAGLATTWVQSMVLARRGEPPSEAERAAYLACLERVLAAGAPLRGVLLYGLARTVHQPEAAELAPLPREWMEAWAERIRGVGLEVRLTP